MIEDRGSVFGNSTDSEDWITDTSCNGTPSVPVKLLWFIRHLSDGLYILFKFVKSLWHLGLAIGNVWCVRWFSWTLYASIFNLGIIFTPQPSGLEGYCRHGPGGRAGGCQTCGTHISVTSWWIFSIRSSVELSRPVVVYCHGHLPICPIWACPWAKNLSNLAQIGSRLCGTHISETVGWIDPI